MVDKSKIGKFKSIIFIKRYTQSLSLPINKFKNQNVNKSRIKYTSKKISNNIITTRITNNAIHN